ncbi:polycystin-1-like [Photinus pyralis]|uniref:polycystin-1-like n=1 Tax=Photinus pyralis TaxID=7054 RepID=UPI0012674E37|nr:polycystin-1-like [Photinus pyralis]XP_031346194.1 polycystin-1-like [Photinus pyralis]
MPVPVILGGNVRVVPSGKPFRVDGKHSVNYDVSPDQEALLYYKWECVSHTNPDDKFCAQGELSHRNEMVMPAARDGDRLTVFLSVSTEHSPWIRAKQEIIVQDGGYQINIECVRNCRNTINYRSTIYLEAFCEDCPGRNYTWKMTPGPRNKKVQIDFDRETLSSNSKLIIKKEVLVPGDEYQFVVWRTT